MASHLQPLQVTDQNQPSFLREFRHWRLINKNNEVISVPFQRVLTALTYIKGPLVSNWADGQDKALETSTTTGGIAKADEVLWNNFKSAFKMAWMDTHDLQMPMISS